MRSDGHGGIGLVEGYAVSRHIRAPQGNPGYSIGGVLRPFATRVATLIECNSIDPVISC